MATFKVNLDTRRLGIELGDFKAGVDVETLREALTVVADGANAMKLMFLAGASVATAATVIVGRYIMKTWPWMKPSFENDKTLQLSCPSDKAEEFEELTKAGGELLSLTKPVELLKKDFKDMGVDDDMKNKIDKLTQKLKDIKLVSVERLKSAGEDAVGDHIRGGKVHTIKQGGTEIVAPSSSAKGTSIGRLIEGDAVVTDVKTNTTSIVGGSEELHKYALNKKSGNQIQVITRFTDGTERLEEMFGSTDRVKDIVDAILRQKNKKITKICYYEKTEVIKTSTQISELEKTGPLLVELDAYED